MKQFLYYRFFLMTLILITSFSFLKAQTPNYVSQAIIPAGLGNTVPYYYGGSGTRAQELYPASIFASIPGPRFIKTIYFVPTVSGSWTYNNFEVSLGQPSITSLSTSVYETGVTRVLTKTAFTITRVADNWLALDLDVPFYFNPTLPLVLEINLTNAATTSWTSQYHNPHITGMYRNYSASYSATAPTAGSASLVPLIGFDFKATGSNDASVSALVSPVSFCPGPQPIKVKILNTGVNRINNVTVNWDLDGIPQTAMSITHLLDTVGGILPSDTTIQLSSSTTFSANIPRVLRVWTSMPNGVADTVTYNDTLYSTIQPGLNGIYTIAPSFASYSTFTAAINDLNKFGTCGPVIFNVAAGSTYSEAPLNIKSSNYSVVFQKSGFGLNPQITGISGIGTTDAVVTLNGCKNITFDGIDIADNSSTVANDRMEYGYKLINYSATIGTSNNTIKNSTITLQRANTSSIGILQSASSTGGGFASTSLSGANHNNRYENVKIKNCYNGILLQGTAGFPDSNNVITSTGGDTTIVGGITANDIGNGTTLVTGIQCIEQKNVEVSNTIIRNLTHTSTLLPSGIWINNASTTALDYGKARVYGNTIYNLSRTVAAAGTGALCGIKIDVATNSSAVVYNNVIYGMSSANTTASIATVQTIRGISHGTATGTGSAEYYHNSIYINNSNAMASVAGFWKGGTSNVTVRNNISNVVSVAQATTVKHHAVYLNAGSMTSSNNVLWSSPTTNGFLGYATSDRATLPLFAASTSLAAPTDGNEQGSANANPNFTSVSNLTFSSATPAVMGGIAITSFPIITDIIGNTRNSTSPTIGAYESTQTLFDSSAPVITNVTIKNSSLPTVYANIKDNDNSLFSAGNIQLWYRLGTSGAFSSLSPDSVPLGTMNGRYKWGTSLSSLPLGLYQFYIAARDQVGSGNNIAVNPIQATTFNGFNLFDPVNYLNNPDASINTRTFVKTSILAAGTYSVGPTGTYANLTAVANVLNSSELNGNVIFELQPNYDGTIGEVLPITFNEFISNGGPWKVIIRPAVGSTSLVTTGILPASAAPVINLNGTKRITFDGRPGGLGSAIEWTIRSKRSTTISNSPAILFINGAQLDTIRYVNVESNNTTATSGTVFFSTSGAIGNSYNVISNSNIRNRADTTISGSTHAVGIYSSGTTGITNDSNTITNNNIANFTTTGVHITATANGNGWVISNNSLFVDTIFTVAQTAIRFESGSGKNTIIGNFIGGNAPLCGGNSWLNSGNIAWRGIVSNTSQTDSSFIRDNTIQNVSLTGGTGTYSAIELTGGLSSIRGNTIGHLSTPNSIQTSQLGTIISIWLNAATNTAQIYDNVIANITSTGNTTAVGHNGIRIATGVVANPLVIRNNTIRNLSSANPTVSSTTASTVGILSLYAGTQQTIADNTIANLMNSAAAGTSVFGINISNASGIGVISGNKILGLTNTSNLATALVVGIHLDLSSSWSVFNNMVTLGGTQDSSFILVGIQDKSAGTSNNIYYNSVVISGTALSSLSTVSQAYRRTTTATTNVSNNIFINTRIGGTANYAIANTNALPATGWKANYNDLYSSNAAQIGLWNTTVTDFPTWKTTSINDTASINILPSFISATDLHLTTPTLGNVSFAGRPIAGFGVDIDGQTRNANTPYMGADENLFFPLPVKLLTFTAQKEQTNVILNWTTASESNSSHFEIERSTNGKTFEFIGKLIANGNTISLVNYKYKDASSPLKSAQTVYYRLKILDQDGYFEYSNIVLVSEKDKFSKDNLNCYPNPFNNELTIGFETATNTQATINVLDITGKTILTHYQQTIQGKNLIKIDTERFKAGLYFISVEFGTEKFITKILKP